MVVTAAASESKDAIAAVPYVTVLVEVLEQCFDRGIVAMLNYHAKQLLTVLAASLVLIEGVTLSGAIKYKYVSCFNEDAILKTNA